MSRPAGGRGVALLAAVAALGGCADRRIAFAPDGAIDRPAATISESYIQGMSELDVLFVIDDSRGMAPLQQALVEAAGAFIDRLTLSGIDWRIGVTSSDLGIAPYQGPGCPGVGAGGALQTTPRVPGCAPPPEPYITPANVQDPAAAFACIGLLGEGGCGFERPLHAALTALQPLLMPDVNRGFVRERADLMVVWVSDEDDCSASDRRLYDPDATDLGPWDSFRCFAHDIACLGEGPDGLRTGCAAGDSSYLVPVEEVQRQMEELKPQARVLALGIVGPPEPVRVIDGSAGPELAASCAGGATAARPAIRFHELLTAMGGQGLALSACRPDLGQGLVQVAAQLGGAAGPYCLRHALADPALPRCRVAVTEPDGARREVPPARDGASGFALVHPLTPGCANGAIVFDEDVAPVAGASVRITCDFLSDSR